MCEFPLVKGHISSVQTVEPRGQFGCIWYSGTLSYTYMSVLISSTL